MYIDTLSTPAPVSRDTGITLPSTSLEIGTLCPSPPPAYTYPRAFEVVSLTLTVSAPLCPTLHHTTLHYPLFATPSSARRRGPAVRRRRRCASFLRCGECRHPPTAPPSFPHKPPFATTFPYPARLVLTSGEVEAPAHFRDSDGRDRQLPSAHGTSSVPPHPSIPAPQHS